MKKLCFFLAAVLMSFSLAAQTWTADKAHSKVSFSITHMGISDVTGLFNDFDASITASKPDFSDAVFTLSVNVASVDTEVEKRDNHLRSADFFDVEKFPEMTFKSTSIRKAGKDRYRLSGDLTLHGVTRPVTMEVWYRGTIENQSKSKVAGFQVTGTIKRSDFHVGDKFAPPMLSDEVAIRADGEFIRQ